MRSLILFLLLSASAFAAESLENKIQRLEKLSPDDYQFGRLLAEISSEAAPDQEQRLLKIVGPFSDSTYSKQQYLPVVVDMKIRFALERQHIRFPLQFQEVAGTAPDKMPKDTYEAWKIYQRAAAPFRKLVAEKADQKPISYQANTARFWALANDLLSGQRPVKAEEFLAYDWGGWCGTGSEMLYVPRSYLTFLALLGEGRTQEAVGAALALQTGFDPETTEIPAVGTFLQQSVPDWEQLAVGALAETDLRSEATIFSNRNFVLQLLAESGTGKSIPFLIYSASNVQSYSVPAYITALGTYLESADTKEQTGSRSSRSDRIIRRASPVAVEQQKQIVKALVDLSGDNASFEIVEAVAEAASQSKLPEARTLLRRLANHPSDNVSRKAVEALELLGEKVELIPRPGPSRFSIKLNGQPLGLKDVEWYVHSQNGGTSSSATLGEDNTFTIPSQYFLNPLRKVDHVRFTSPSGKSPADPLYIQDVPPGDLTKVKEVTIITTPWMFQFSSSRNLAAFTNQKIAISLRRQETAGGFSIATSSFQIPWTPQLTLPSIQKGTYYVDVRLPGTTGFQKEVVHDGSVLRISLDPASDVRIPVIAGGRNIFGLQRKLWRDGKEFSVINQDYQEDCYYFRGLPPGSYILKIPSSAEQKHLENLSEDSPDNFPELEVAFKVELSSPSVIETSTLTIP